MKTNGTRKFAAEAELGLRGTALRRLFAVVPVLRLIVLFCIAIFQGFRFQVSGSRFFLPSWNLKP